MISLIIGPPISGLLLRLDGMLGLRGWQWLFLIEALPPILMCFVIWRLADRPAGGGEVAQPGPAEPG